MQDLTIIENFLPLELGGIDVILGMQWLETLGSMNVNLKSQTMRFKVLGENVMLKGDASLTRSLISLKAMMRTIRHEG
ncbi:hypothetical protein L484_000518 [Morus notabilis]|uniref:Ty3-gypsy retrotransposon protein n=1 Tax=Morus notabilis TaxID=981085 RepID=W9RJ40_9ROSA|nr:hypothetical protein L484_000518 [Morus notabilis]